MVLAEINSVKSNQTLAVKRLYQSYSPPHGVYLSIDLDFWGRNPITPADRQWLRSMLRRARSVRCFLRHDQALEHINSPPIAAEGRELWNLDTHSDLAGWATGGYPYALNEGTWVDHVVWPRAERFLWLHPDIAAGRLYGRGRCDGSYQSPFRGTHPIWPKRKHTVRPVDLRDMDLPAQLLGACVVLSRPWFEDADTLKAGVRVFEELRARYDPSCPGAENGDYSKDPNDELEILDRSVTMAA